MAPPPHLPSGRDDPSRPEAGGDSAPTVPVPSGHTRVGGAVLAGGGSRRMGRDKAGIEVAGSSLLSRTRTALTAALGSGAPVVTVGSPGDPRPGPWVPDLRPGAGPLAGLEAALAWGRHQDLAAVLVVGVDHPWLEPAVLRLLVDRLMPPAGSDGRQAPGPRRSPTAGHAAPGPARPGAGGPAATALETADGPLLLLGAYRTETLEVVAGLLDADQRRLQSLADHLDLDVVDPTDWHHLDPSGATALDVDAPADLETTRPAGAAVHDTGRPAEERG